jgi:predicted RNA-binding Zn-ribbon protein involved in translation (DUF1610 family)
VPCRRRCRGGWQGISEAWELVKVELTHKARPRVVAAVKTLLHGWWVASCPDCGHELGRSRDQAQAEQAGRRHRCPVCQPAGEAVA